MSKVKLVNISNIISSQNFKCSRCDYIAHGEKGMRLHSKYSHGVSKPYEIRKMCSLCDREFSESAREHMIVHFHRGDS